MTAYVSLPELKPFLGNFISNDIGDTCLSDDLLEEKLIEVADKIADSWNYGEENLPASPSSPLSWLDLILKNLNLLLTIEEIIADRAIAKNELFLRQAASYTILSKERFTDFRVGRLNASILSFIEGNNIQTTSFISDLQEAAKDTNGLEITEDSNPNITTTTQLCLMESAWTRAKAISQGYEVTINNLSSTRLRNYKNITLALVSPQVHRIANLGNTSFIGDSIINNKISAGLENLKDLSTGKRYRNIFLDQE